MAIKNINTDLQIEAGLRDGDGDLGTNNQVLISTGTGINWVDGSGTGIIGGPYLPLIGGTLTGNLLLDDATLTVGTNAAGRDVIFRGGTSGAYFMYDASEDGVIIVAPTDEVALGIRVVGGAVATVPQFQVGRGTSQYLGIRVDDRISSVIHRQDETDAGVMQMNQEIWDNGTGIHLWNWKSYDGAGASGTTRMTLNKTGELNVTTSVTATTFLGDLNGTINTVTTGFTQTAGDDSTKIATTEYVDTAVAAVPIGDYLPLIGGTMTGTTNHNDNVYSRWGTGADLRLWHNGTNSYVFNYGGNLYLGTGDADKDTVILGDNGSGGETAYITVDGSSTHTYFSNPGNVGINATNPVRPLQVEYSSTTAPGFSIKNTNTTVDNNVVMAFNRDNSDSLGWTLGIDSGDNNKFKISEDGDNLETNTRIVIRDGGNVGIGVNTPIYKLDVAGDIGVEDYIYHKGDSDTYFGFPSANQFSITTGGTQQVTVTEDNVSISGSLSYTKPTANGEFSGEIVTFGTYAETTGAGELVCLGASQVWNKANNGNGTDATGMLGIAMGSSPSDGILLRGFARTSTYNSSNGYTNGGKVYIKNVNGDMTSTIPTVDWVRIVGYVVETTTPNGTLYFCPDNTYIIIPS
tara:strand:- start:1638 stop:3533 length:1896 start_codon:yes stop_codon:yes gene_type:complete